ncbi:MAG: hypothetical protein K6G50_08930 [bacterium]|nr:hypothetical protein [bacterium]
MQNDKKRKLYLGLIGIMTAVILSFFISEYYFYDLRLLSSNELHIVKFLPGDDIDLYAGVEEVSITFDQDITETLGEVSADEVGAVRFIPDVEGIWRWASPRQLCFKPKEPFESNETYALRVAGIRSLSGKMLSNVYEFNISIPAVKINEIFVENPNGTFDNAPKFDEVTSGRFNASSLKPRIIVLFDSSIPELSNSNDIESFEHNFKETFYDFELQAYGNCDPEREMAEQCVKHPAIHLDYSRPASREDVKALNLRPEFAEVLPELSRMLILTPDQELEKAELYKLDAHMANNGPVKSFKFQTNDDFRALVMGDTKCPDLPVTVFFSNAVNLDEFLEACKIEPAVNGKDHLKKDNIVPSEASSDAWGNVSNISFIMPFIPGQKYTLTLDPTMQDAYGNVLKGDNSFEFIASDRYPMVKCAGGEEVIIPSYAQKKITLNVLNNRRSNVAISRIRKVNHQFEMVHLVKDVHTDFLNVNFQNPERNKVTQYDLDLAPFVGKDNYAWLFLQFDYENCTLVQFTDLQINFYNGTDLAVTTASGAPGAYLKAELHGDKGDGVLWKGRTDTQGHVVIPGLAERLKNEPPNSLIHLVVYQNKDRAVKFFKRFRNTGTKQLAIDKRAPWAGSEANSEVAGQGDAPENYSDTKYQEITLSHR